MVNYTLAYAVYIGVYKWTSLLSSFYSAYNCRLYLFQEKLEDGSNCISVDHAG